MMLIVTLTSHSMSSWRSQTHTPDSHCRRVQMDLSRGVLAAVPGWAHVRLLAPHADLRLLVCGHSSLVDSHRLR